MQVPHTWCGLFLSHAMGEWSIFVQEGQAESSSARTLQSLSLFLCLINFCWALTQCSAPPAPSPHLWKTTDLFQRYEKHSHQILRLSQRLPRALPLLKSAARTLWSLCDSREVLCLWERQGERREKKGQAHNYLIAALASEQGSSIARLGPEYENSLWILLSTSNKNKWICRKAKSKSFKTANKLLSGDRLMKKHFPKWTQSPCPISCFLWTVCLAQDN